MKRFIFLAVALGLSVLISGSALAHGGGHGGGGHGGGGGHMGGFGGGGHMGGFSGGHMGGFSGGHIGGFSGGGMRMAAPSFGGGGMRMAAPSFGGMRAAPSMGSLSGMRLSPSSGIRAQSGLGSVRINPYVGGLGSAGLGSAGLNRVNPGLGRVTPSTSVMPPRVGMQSPGARANLGAMGSMRNSGMIGTSQTALRPGNLGSTALGSAALANRTGTGAVHMPFVGRVTPQHLNNFLSMPANRGGANAFSANRLNVNALGSRTNITNINSFNRLNTTQVNRINTNINNGFRNFHHGNFNRGFGFNSFGFGFGSPYWNNWGYGVRNFWNPYGYYGLFGNRFWATNYLYYPWRRSYYWWGGYPYSYWWNYPTWGGLTNWFPYYGWSNPYYYGYGPGGNIVYNNGYVYMNDVPIATTADYAASAAELATVPTPANPDAATEWLPLGTWALSESEADTNPSRVVQLAVDKDGIISGTMFNKTTNQTYPIQGRVDRETQRVAFTIGDTKDVVFETGIYNLTQQQTPILAHGDGREETYLLLRLEQPKTDGSGAPAAPATSGGVIVPSAVAPGPAPSGTAPITPAPPVPMLP